MEQKKSKTAQLVALLFAITMLLPLTARADMLPNDNHQISNYIVADNASDYPNYNLYLTFDGVAFGDEKISESPMQVNNNGATNGIIAVNKSNESKIQIIDGTANCGARCFDLNANKQLFIASNLSLSFTGFLPDENPVKKITQTIHIDSISDTAMTAHLTNINSVDKNGDKTDQEALTPTNSELANSWDGSLGQKLLYLFIGIGVGAISYSLVKKTCKK